MPRSSWRVNGFPSFVLGPETVYVHSTTYICDLLRTNMCTHTHTHPHVGTPPALCSPSVCHNEASVSDLGALCLSCSRLGASCCCLPLPALLGLPGAASWFGPGHPAPGPGCAEELEGWGEGGGGGRGAPISYWHVAQVANERFSLVVLARMLCWQGRTRAHTKHLGICG